MPPMPPIGILLKKIISGLWNWNSDGAAPAACWRVECGPNTGSNKVPEEFLIVWHSSSLGIPT